MSENSPSVSNAYEYAHLTAVLLTKRIHELLAALPDSDECQFVVHWGHVGSLSEVTHRLSAVVAFLEGTEK